MASPIPTEAEFVVLETLWDGGPAAVREIHERLGRSIGYTGVLKLLQIMHTKGLVRRDESERAHVYTAVGTREAIETQLVENLAHRAFGGSSTRLALRALATDATDPKDLKAIRALLKRAAPEGVGKPRAGK